MHCSPFPHYKRFKAKFILGNFVLYPQNKLGILELLRIVARAYAKLAMSQFCPLVYKKPIAHRLKTIDLDVFNAISWKMKVKVLKRKQCY